MNSEQFQTYLWLVPSNSPLKIHFSIPFEVYSKLQRMYIICFLNNITSSMNNFNSHIESI